MKKRWIYAVLILAFTVIACSKDNDDEVETGGEAATFNLTLENNTGRKIFIYLKGSDPNAGFEERGQLVFGEEITINNLGIRQTYVVRASLTGGSPEDYFYEQNVFHQTPTNLRLTIEE